MASDKCAALPTLEPIEAKLSATEKRDRQRLHVKRTYYRKVQLMQGLRDEVETLEKEYRQRLSEYACRRESPTEALAAISLAVSDQPHQPAQLSRIYEKLCQSRHHLRAENGALCAAIEAHERLALELQCLVSEEKHNSSDAERSHATSILRPIPGSSAPVTLRSLITVEECQAIARSTFVEMLSFRESHGFMTTGVSVFGWRDMRLMQGDRFQFSMKKLFLNITPFELSLRSWAVVTSSHLSSLYSSTLNVRTYTLHRVDDDNIIRYRIMCSADGRFLVKTLFLVSRFESPLGYTSILRSIDHTKWLAPCEAPAGVEEQWIDYYNWSIFERTGDTDAHCKLDFGGETRVTPILSSDAWMLEVLTIMLRWENIVIGPIFSICCE